MPRIGITGGVATGKSTVAKLMQERGAIIFSADEAARAVVGPGSSALRKIAATFGPDYLLPDGSLNRPNLAQRIFSDPQARRTLEKITHPLIERLLLAQMEAARKDFPPDPLVAVEVPLLYEAGREGWFDKIVVVASSEETQIARLRWRNGLSSEEARARIAAQMPLSEKIARADIVIWNEGDLNQLAAQVDAALRQIDSVCRTET